MSRKNGARHVSRAVPSKKKPELPAWITALARVKEQQPPRWTPEQLARIEEAFGYDFPVEARRALLALGSHAVEGGVADVPDLATLKRLNGLDGSPDALAWTTSRLGLFTVAQDAEGNRLCMDVADPSGNAPVWLCTTRLGIAAAANAAFPRATDLVQAFALYAAGADVRQAAADVERLTREMEEMRKRRPGVIAGRDDAMARLQAAFGGARAAEPTGPAPTAEEESRLSAALEAAQAKHRATWMPFMEQFSRWPVYWQLHWNGPRSFSMGTDQLDNPLLLAWRTTLPVATALVENRADALATELGQREPVARAVLPYAEAHAFLGEHERANALLAQWAPDLGQLPRRAAAIGRTTGQAAASTETPTLSDASQWAAWLKLPRARADKFLGAVAAQFAADLAKHGTTNILGATKAAVRRGADGRNIVEAGLGHVPLEVRKDLFEGRPVVLSGQFLQALGRELSRRLRLPRAAVEKPLTRLRNVVQDHVNARAPLTIPGVGTFRIKNEPAPSGAPRYYLLMDVDDALVEAAQKTVLHQVHADYAAADAML